VQLGRVAEQHLVLELLELNRYGRCSIKVTRAPSQQ
jgi:hypothetical protein